MRRFTADRNAETIDEIWLVEHPAVYTLGRRGSGCDLSQLPPDAEVIQSDRGGLVTWHGPGQLVLYWLADSRRLGLSVRDLVQSLEQAVIGLLEEQGIAVQARRDAPGVYLADGAKLASVGLRLRKGCSMHGLALNVANDLTPFSLIAPCGLTGLRVSSLRELGINLGVGTVAKRLTELLADGIYSELRWE